MNIRSELYHAFYPHKSRIFWASLYIGLTALVLGVILIFASHIRTRILPQGSITLTTNYSKYVVGETISYTLTNNYNSSVYFTHPCPAEPLAVYRRTTTGWTRLHGSADGKVCITQQRQTIVPPLSTATSTLSPWQSMFSQPGTYRLVAVVEGSSTLPYVDFDIMNPPAPIIHQIIIPAPPKASPPKTSAPTQYTAPSQTSGTTPPPSSSSPTPTRAPQTYTLNVNSSGNYSPAALTLYSGDSIKFVYTAPRNNEVRTRFTAQSPTTTSLSSVTLDSEFTSRTVTYTARGTWTFKADDHNGNTGTLTVK